MDEYRENPYQILEVSKDADPEEIKKAYRRLSRLCHPDLNPDDPKAEERFKKIKEAYDILSDQKRKENFDMSGGIRISGGAAATIRNFCNKIFQV